MKVLFVGVFLNFLLIVNVSAKQYSYVSVSDVKYDASEKTFTNYENTFSIDKTQHLIFIGHTFSPFSECKETKWICVFNENLNFAIPLEKIEKLTSWKYKNFIFDKTLLSGRDANSEKIYKVGVFEKNDKVNFNVIYYSLERGVIGFSILYGEDTETYWLLGMKGFGYRNN